MSITAASIPAFCERPDPVFRRAAAILCGFALLLWTFLAGEICDWGKFTAWWSASPGIELDSGSASVRSVDPRLTGIHAGDRLIELNGEPIASATAVDSWARALRHSRPDDVWHLRLVRDGTARDMSVRLGQDGWRYITAAAGILAIPLLFLFWLAYSPAIPNLDRFMLTGFLINAALSIFLCHFPLIGMNHPGMLADLPAAAALAEAFRFTAPAFALYFLWRWPSPLQLQLRSATCIAFLSAALLMGFAQSGVLVGLVWVFRVVQPAASARQPRAGTSAIR